MARRKADDLNKKTFEELLAELEANVKLLETGELPLEESMKVFTRSMELSHTAADKLQTATTIVEELNQDTMGNLKKKEFLIDGE